MRNYNYRFTETAQRTVQEIMRILDVYDYAWTGSNAMFLQDIPLNRHLHDIDLLVPASYKARIIEKLRETKLLKVTKQSYGYKGKDIISIKGVRTPEIDLCFIPNDVFRKETEIIEYAPLGYFQVATFQSLINIKLDWFRPKDKFDLKLIVFAQKLKELK